MNAFTNLDSRAAYRMADAINAAYRAGKTIRIGTDEVKAFHTDPAAVYQNGTLSVSTKARSKSTRTGTGTRYVKRGQSVTIEIA